MIMSDTYSFFTFFRVTIFNTIAKSDVETGMIKFTAKFPVDPLTYSYKQHL